MSGDEARTAAWNELEATARELEDLRLACVKVGDWDGARNVKVSIDAVRAEQVAVFS